MTGPTNSLHHTPTTTSNVNVKVNVPALDLGELLGVLLRADEGDGQALGPEAARAAHAVQVRVRAVLLVRRGWGWMG